MKGLVRPQNFAILILLVASLALFFRHSQDFVSGQGKVPGDFKVYVRAVERAQAGVDPYIPSEGSPYKYSPGALTPLFFLPQQESTAWVIFKFLCVASWITAIVVGAPLNAWRHVFLLVAGIAMSWKGLLETLDYGQIEFLVLFLAVVAARIFDRRHLLCGFILGCLPWFKLPWGLLLFPFLLAAIQAGRGELKKYLTGYVAGSLLFGVIAPALVLGPIRAFELTQSWLALLRTQPADLYSGDMNQSIWSTASRWISHGPAFGWIGGILLLASSIYLATRLIRQSMTRAASTGPLAWITPWLILGQLVNPLSWRWGSMLLIGAPFAADPALLTRKPQLLLPFGLGILLLLLLQQNPIAQLVGFSHWTELHHFGSVTIYWLLILALCIFGNETKREMNHVR